jgi:hypothetical protein
MYSAWGVVRTTAESYSGMQPLAPRGENLYWNICRNIRASIAAKRTRVCSSSITSGIEKRRRLARWFATSGRWTKSGPKSQSARFAARIVID